ncbi:unnamed protein product [Cuscuta epithymum]|uniref:Uncharacterized protein n=1 Tax=Cuscuta epithymum TaxID=186058 RepID=A0AAV0EAV9_9ASTE|nr:unnamed protein product [Cuscuta epithymum]
MASADTAVVVHWNGSMITKDNEIEYSTHPKGQSSTYGRRSNTSTFVDFQSPCMILQILKVRSRPRKVMREWNACQDELTGTTVAASS